MKTLRLFAVFALCSVVSMAGSVFCDGDAELDKTLVEINVEAKADLPAFKAEVTASYGISGQAVDEMLVKDKMAPADVIMAAEVSMQSKKPLKTVVEAYKANKANKGKGWGVVAASLGIKPGSAEFKALKDKVKAKKDKMKTANAKKVRKGQQDQLKKQDQQGSQGRNDQVKKTDSGSGQGSGKKK